MTMPCEFTGVIRSGFEDPRETGDWTTVGSVFVCIIGCLNRANAQVAPAVGADGTVSSCCRKDAGAISLSSASVYPTARDKAQLFDLKYIRSASRQN